MLKTLFTCLLVLCFIALFFASPLNRLLYTFFFSFRCFFLTDDPRSFLSLLIFHFLSKLRCVQKCKRLHSSHAELLFYLYRGPRWSLHFFDPLTRTFSCFFRRIILFPRTQSLRASLRKLIFFSKQLFSRYLSMPYSAHYRM